MKRIKMTIAVLGLGAILSSPVSAVDVPDYVAAAMEAPSAHNPCFDKTGLWPEDVRNTAYYKQKWAPARLLVWVGPRKGKIEGEQLKDPANWLEFQPVEGGGYGQARAATAPPDGKTDVQFPDSPGRMVVAARSGFPRRHLTVGRNVRCEIDDHAGNVWAYGAVEGGFVHMDLHGDRDTFFRGKGGCKALKVNKAAGSSAELIGGHIRVVDWMEINTGTLIVGPGYTLRGGLRHQNIIAPKGTMALMDGATFLTSRWKPHDYDLDIFGTVMAGMPDRPLRADATFALSGKPKGAGGKGEPGDRSLRLQPIGSIIVHSAAPEKARLVFRMRTQEETRGEYERYESNLLDMIFAGKTEFDGVVFQDIAAGGIQVADAQVHQGWKHVVHGGRNAVQPDKLFSYGVSKGIGGVWSPQKTAAKQLEEIRAKHRAE
jgi:hypothetical protein